MVAPRLVLIGPPAAGKSTVAAILGRRTGMTVLDSDDVVVHKAGKPIPKIFADDGEPAFREIEAAAIAEALTTHDGVLALGGGAVTTAATRRRLREYATAGGLVVFLDINDRTAAQRLGGGDRPLLTGADPLANWRRLRQARQPLYESLATMTVDVSKRRSGAVATDIIAALGGPQLPQTSEPHRSTTDRAAQARSAVETLLGDFAEASA